MDLTRHVSLCRWQKVWQQPGGADRTPGFVQASAAPTAGPQRVTATPSPTLQAELSRLSSAVRAFSTIGAALRLRNAGTQAHPAVEARLNAAIEALLPGGLDSVDARQVATALEFVALQFEEAAELFQNPARPPGWVLRDPAMLQAMGQASRPNFQTIRSLAAARPGLDAALTGRFLDVGTGVGAIALEAAEHCPALRVVGLDIWEPALSLARANVAASPHSARIEIRAQDVTALDEPAAYSLAWLPAPFLAREMADAALDRLAVALAPGGWLVVGRFALPPDAAVAALAALRVVRSGGHVWETAAMEQQLRARGFIAVESCGGGTGVDLVIGSRP
jgi:precorrin-6B methylase 2